MKFSSFVLFVCAGLVTPVWGAQQLVIHANETYTVTPDQRQLYLSSLTVGDNAVIRFAKGVERWQLEALAVSIGNDVTIDASGLGGIAGQSGASYEGSTDACQQGRAGEVGESGAHGGNGVAISMRLVVEKMGGLTINTTGGAGGAGGHGGNGQGAGETRRCKGASGGAGGQGGNAGHGGNGGHVRIVYNYMPNSNVEEPLDNVVTVVSNAGKGGAAGQGGDGGDGSEGRYINQRTLTGNKKWIAGGKPGQEGETGQAGRDGLKGQVVIERDLGSMISALAPKVNAVNVIPRDVMKAPSSSLNDEVTVSQQVWQQTQATLKKLVEALEKSENNYRHLQERVTELEKSQKVY